MCLIIIVTEGHQREPLHLLLRQTLHQAQRGPLPQLLHQVKLFNLSKNIPQNDLSLDYLYIRLYQKLEKMSRGLPPVTQITRNKPSGRCMYVASDNVYCEIKKLADIKP